MLTFNPPISIVPPIYRGKVFPSIQISQLNYDVEYSDVNRTALARLVGLGISVNLWSGDEYTQAGEFTTSDTDNRLISIFGSDPGAFISSLLEPRSSFRFGAIANAPEAVVSEPETTSAA